MNFEYEYAMKFGVSPPAMTTQYTDESEMWYGIGQHIQSWMPDL